jgi:HEAT repeat protein
MALGPTTAFLNSGHYYGGMMRSPQGILSARQKLKIQIAAVTPEAVTLQKHLSLDSRMLTGSEPRLSAVGEGQIIFDRNAGLPKSVALQCKTLVVTENATRRSDVTLRWERLEGTERDAALNPPPPQPVEAQKVSPNDLTKILAGLKSNDPQVRQTAARQLRASQVEAPSTEVIALMVSLAEDRDEVVQNAALTLLAKQGTPEQVPLLVKALASTDAGLRATVTRGLGRLKDKRAAEALAELVATGPLDQLQYNTSRNTEAVEALVSIGAAAEPAVLNLFKEKSNQTRWQACGILKQIGTKKSLRTLMELTLSPSKELSEAAAEANRAIQAREGN